MTHPSPGSGARAGRARGGHRPRGDRRRSAILALLLAVAVILTPGAASASTVLPQASTPSPSPTATPIVSVALTPLGRGIVRAGAGLTTSFSVRNDTPEDLPAAALTLALGDEPLASGDDIDAWIRSGSTDGDLSIVDWQSTDPVLAGAESLTTSVVAGDSPALSGRAPGVYPLRAEYGDTQVSRSVITVVDPAADAGTVPIALLVAVTAGPQRSGLLTSAELTALTAPDGRLTALLQGVMGASAILAVDPAIVASIRVLGSSAPATAVEWLGRLAALPNERFALQFGDADVAAQVAADLPGLLAPTTLAYAMTAADFAPVESSPTPSPQPTPSDAEPALPDLESLLAVPGATGTLYWPAEGAADDAVVATLDEWTQGTDASTDPLTIVSSAAVADGAGAVPVHGTVGDGGAGVLVYEDGVSAALRTAVEADDEKRGGALAALNAHLTLAMTTAQGPLLVTTDRLETATVLGLQGALTAVTAAPGAGSASLGDLTSAPAPALTLDGAADADRIAALQRMLIGEGRIATFATILDDATLLTGPERTAMLQLIGGAWAADADAWESAMTDHYAATAATLESVQIQQPTTIRLVSPDADLPVFVTNDLPWPVNLELVAVPDDLRLEVEPRISFTAEAQVNTRVSVPVRARVGSGEVQIELTLLSPTGEQIGPARSMDVTVRADWERIGVVVLGVLVVGLFLVGLIRTILRRRRVRATAADGSREESGG